MTRERPLVGIGIGGHQVRGLLQVHLGAVIEQQQLSLITEVVAAGGHARGT